MYIPNSEVMFKLMRACIEVKEPEDLVFYDESSDRIKSKEHLEVHHAQ